LQSGADGVLKRMNRPYTAVRARENILFAKGRIPRLGLGFDVMVGFPGETEADFARTVEAVEKTASYLLVFSFSPRPGTAAEGFTDCVPPLVKKERSRVLRSLSAELAYNFAEENIGARVRLLVERRRGPSGRQVGVTGNYLRGELVDAPEGLGGRMISGEVVGLHPDLSLTRPDHGPATVLVRYLEVVP
ncbi:MAG: tRNA (N(6)-L-threonylcarbamoyladenosine(37)-C(2))-methylthiotransferase MtaB, partial [bacterium]|nr:tRNA (N(6)-L-threonylcarbamoyladenosine(37)-C(2))-methylthiotransferase MtaB [bacterium]